MIPREFLRTLDIFAGLDDASLDALAAAMRLTTWAPGSEIFREGADGNELVLIASGTARTFKVGRAGVQVPMSELHAGDLAGLTSLLEGSDDEPGRGTVHSATLRAEGEVQAFVLSRADFDQLVLARPLLVKGLLRHLAHKIRRRTLTVAQMLADRSDPRPRIAVFDTKDYVRSSFTAPAERRGLGLQFFEPRLGLETVALADGFPIVCAFVNDCLDAKVITRLASYGVGLIAMRCAGYNNVDLEAATDAGISVVRVPAYSPHAVAEHTVALLMCLNRKVHRAYNRVREGNFSLSSLVGFDLHGKVAAVLGTGKIGRGVVRILRGFGMEVLLWDAYADQAFATEVGARYVPLEEAFSRADVVSLHVPLLPSTHHLIDAKALAQMKPGVTLLNTSRGALVDTRALIQALKRGHIGAAGLDVYEEESEYFFEDHSAQVIADDTLARLMTFNNVLVTSHQAFLTHEALANIADTTLDNVMEWLSGKRSGELTNAVLPKEWAKAR